MFTIICLLELIHSLFDQNMEPVVGDMKLPFKSTNNGRLSSHKHASHPNEDELPNTAPSRNMEILEMQTTKLREMRAAQIGFFERKMSELRDNEVTLDSKIGKLERLIDSLSKKEEVILESYERLRLEKQEIHSIKELLRTETQSVEFHTRDLRRLIKKYETIIEPLAKTKTPIGG